MASSLVITINSEKTQTDISQQVRPGADKPREALRGIIRLLRAIEGRTTRASVKVQTSDAAPVAATGTVTPASFVQNDTVTVAGVVFTGKNSPSLETEFDASGNDTADAAALATKINAHSTVSKVVSASAASGVCTITCLVPGVVGNFLSLAISAHGSVSAATLAGGTGGATEAAQTFSAGL